MKLLLVFAIVISVLLLIGCSSIIGGNPKLPPIRPANFSISCYDGGGMLPESESHFVTKDSAGRESFFQQSRNRWHFVPDPAKLDALYARLRELDPTNIKVRDEGMVYDRGGVSIQISFDKTTVNLSNSGSSFVVERDQERFAAIEQEVIQFVMQGLDATKIPCKVGFAIGVADTAIANCAVYFSQDRVFDWARQNAEPLVYDRSMSLLPGSYELKCSATVSGKYVSLDQRMEISKEKHDFHIVLKSDTFEFTQE